jgi:hypothetical protein
VTSIVKDSTLLAGTRKPAQMSFRTTTNGGSTRLKSLLRRGVTLLLYRPRKRTSHPFCPLRSTRITSWVR